MSDGFRHDRPQTKTVVLLTRLLPTQQLLVRDLFAGPRLWVCPQPLRDLVASVDVVARRDVLSRVRIPLPDREPSGGERHICGPGHRSSLPHRASTVSHRSWWRLCPPHAEKPASYSPGNPVPASIPPPKR